MRRPASYRGAIVGFALLFIASGIAYFAWPRTRSVASAPVKARPQDLEDAKRRLAGAKAPRPPNPRRPVQSGGNELSTEIGVSQLHEQDSVPPPEPKSLLPNLIVNREPEVVAALPQAVALPLPPNRDRQAARNQKNGGDPEIGRDPDKFFGDWDHPKLQSTLKLDQWDRWTLVPDDGGPPSAGVCFMLPDGTLNLRGWTNNTVLVLRLGTNVLACQEKDVNGKWIGDGFMRFKSGFNWRAGNLRRDPPNPQDKQLLSGNWDHPVTNTTYIPVDNKKWTERPQIGGKDLVGDLKRLADGSYHVTLDNNEQRRVWVVEANLLAVLPLNNDEQMINEGFLVRKLDPK